MTVSKTVGWGSNPPAPAKSNKEVCIMSEFRRVKEANLNICENGHLLYAEPTGRTILQVKHTCGEWTHSDGNFCQRCGGILYM